MKIVSKFNDFYDCGVAYGIDPKIVYKRFTTYEDGPEAWSPRGMAGRHIIKTSTGKISLDAERHWLYFCGKRYALYRCTAEHMTYQGEFLRYDTDVEWVYTSNETRSFYKSYGYTPPTYSRKYSRYFSSDDQESKKARDKIQIVEDDSVNLQFNSPAVLEQHHQRYTINPCLKDIGFSKVMDPYTAFQEISMYLAGPLTPWEDPDLNPEPDGAQKMINHGMDPVRGFRRN